MQTYTELMEYIIECTLLSKDQLIGPNRLSLFDIIGLECNTTNYAKATGGFRFNSNDKISYVLKDIYYENNDFSSIILSSVSSQGIKSPKIFFTQDTFIRPVLKLKSIVPFLPLIKRDQNNLLKLDLGYYPSVFETDQKTLKELDSLLREEELHTEKGYYLIGDKKEPIYKYKDNYYIRHSANIYYLDLVNEGLIGPIWYKIEPITWYVDMSNKLLISKNLITSNANYTTLDEKDKPQRFEDTVLYKYLNETLLREMFIIDKMKENNIIDNLFKTDYGKNINEKIEKIKDLCKLISPKSRIIIYKKTSEILKKYIENVEYVKPKFDRKIQLSINITDISKIEPIYINLLDNLIKQIEPLKSLIKMKEEVIQYRNMLNVKINKIHNTNKTYDKISNILFLSSKLDNSKTQEIRNKLITYINEYENIINEKIEHFLTEEIELELNDYCKLEFEQNIDKLLQYVRNEIKIIIPKKVLENALMNEEIEWKEGNSLSAFLSSIKYTITSILNKKTRIKYKTEYNNIIDKYIDLFNNPNEDDNYYSKLSTDLRKDLNNLLEELYKESPQIDKENNDRYQIKIVNQLKKSKKILNDTITEEEKKKIDYELITSKIQDINNKYFMSSNLKSTILNILKNKLINKLEKHENNVINKPIYSLDEYNKTLKEILSDITEFEIKLYLYLDEYIKYNKLPKKTSKK